jgi:hypothetical protein
VGGGGWGWCGVGGIVGVGIVLDGEREERAGGCEVVGVIIGDVPFIGDVNVIGIGEGVVGVAFGEREIGGGCDLGSKKVGDY